MDIQTHSPQHRAGQAGSGPGGHHWPPAWPPRSPSPPCPRHSSAPRRRGGTLREGNQVLAGYRKNPLKSFRTPTEPPGQGERVSGRERTTGLGGGDCLGGTIFNHHTAIWGCSCWRGAGGGSPSPWPSPGSPSPRRAVGSRCPAHPGSPPWLGRAGPAPLPSPPPHPAVYKRRCDVTRPHPSG